MNFFQKIKIEQIQLRDSNILITLWYGTTTKQSPMDKKNANGANELKKTTTIILMKETK